MFEKEARERADKLEANQTLGVYNTEEELNCAESYNEGKINGYEEGFKDGAEFGYNKANKEIKLLKETHRQSIGILVEQIEELHKANEWHFVKDGDYPKEKCLAIIFSKVGIVQSYTVSVITKEDLEAHKTVKIIAWKEIVLPELPKEIKEK